MKTTKAIGLALAVMLFAVLALFGTAEAKEYTVKRGDTLWGIAYKTWGTGKLYKAIASANGIKNPNKIFPNQKLIIPSVGKIEIKNFSTSPFGGKAVKGDAKIIQGIQNTSYDKEYKECMTDAVNSSNPGVYKIEKGEMVDCLSDKKGVYCNPEGYIYGYGATAHIWKAECDKEYRKILCDIILVDKCGNLTPRCREEKIIPPILEKVPEEKIPERKVEVTLPPIEEKREIIPVPEYKIPEILPIEEKWAIEHEPIVGAYAWHNDLARGWGGYGEYMAWLRKEYPWGYANGWSPGVGIFGYYSEGDTKTLPHYWWGERGWGPQIGLKYIGETEDGKPWQWQAKLRYVWEHMYGKNEVGYQMHQDNTKLGLYTEVLKRTDPEWIVGATAEGWYALDRDITSSWSGDKPSNRTTLAVNALAQYRLSDDWQVRGSAGPFYQGWDKLWGLRASAEARYRETIMFGPQIAIFPFGLSSVYDGVASAGDLTTLTGFVRLELGAPIRKWDRNVRMEKIKKLDEEKYGVIEEEKPVQSINNSENLVSMDCANPVPYISPTNSQDW